MDPRKQRHPWLFESKWFEQFLRPSFVVETQLGKLLQFEQRDRALNQPPAPGGGQLLLFTGVRYQRELPVPATAKPTKPARPGRRRG